MTDSNMDKNSEQEMLTSVQNRPFWQRIRVYMKFSGPGFLQSAMTLGGGTAGACLIAGSKYMYDLLWVQPLAMFIGTIILAAVAKQTVNTSERPYRVFWERLHPTWALVWGISALLACIIWHIPQYTLATTSLADMSTALGIGTISRWVFAFPILILSIYLLWQYDRGAKGLKIYEIVIKILVWGIVIIFGIVTFASKPDWAAIWRGFAFHNFSKLFEPGESHRVLVVIGMLGATVGINMVFLYPYSLLKKKWSQKYEGVAFFDLITGMTIPFILATTFVIIGTANTIGREGIQATSLMSITNVLSESLGLKISALILGLGLLAIAFSTITTHMLASGFIACEMLNLPTKGWSYRLLALLPAIGIIGAGYSRPFWAAVVTSGLAVIFMPITLVCFLILQNSYKYMKEAMPTGSKRWAWNIALITAIVIIAIASTISFVTWVF